MDNFVTDYVYFNDETQDFENIHIELGLEKNYFVVNISSEHDLNDTYILEILKQLNNNFTKRLRISLVEECKIFVTDKNGKRQIILEYGDFFIKKTIKED